jgi:hypothetical protein
MIARNLPVFIAPLFYECAPGISSARHQVARCINQRASNRYPEQAASFAATEGPKPGASSAPDPKTSLFVKLVTSTLAIHQSNCRANRTERYLHDSMFFSGS